MVSGNSRALVVAILDEDEPVSSSVAVAGDVAEPPDFSLVSSSSVSYLQDEDDCIVRGRLIQARSPSRNSSGQSSPVYFLGPMDNKVRLSIGQSSRTSFGPPTSSRSRGPTPGSITYQMCHKIGHTAPQCTSNRFLSPHVHYVEASSSGLYDLD